MASDVVESVSRDAGALFPSHPDDSTLASACKDGLSGISLVKRVIAELQSRGHKFKSLIELDEAMVSLRESLAFFEKSQLSVEVRSANRETIDAVDYDQFLTDAASRLPPDSWFGEDSASLRGR